MFFVWLSLTGFRGDNLLFFLADSWVCVGPRVVFSGCRNCYKEKVIKDLVHYPSVFKHVELRRRLYCWGEFVDE